MISFYEYEIYQRVLELFRSRVEILFCLKDECEVLHRIIF